MLVEEIHVVGSPCEFSIWLADRPSGRDCTDPGILTRPISGRSTNGLLTLIPFEETRFEESKIVQDCKESNPDLLGRCVNFNEVQYCFLVFDGFLDSNFIRELRLRVKRWNKYQRNDETLERKWKY